MNPTWWNASPCTDADAAAVAAGDEWESTVVDVQQRALSPLKQDSLVRFTCIEQVIRCVTDHAVELLGP